MPPNGRNSEVCLLFNFGFWVRMTVSDGDGHAELASAAVAATAAAAAAAAAMFCESQGGSRHLAQNTRCRAVVTHLKTIKTDIF